MARRTLRIDRKKMETEKWAVKRWVKHSNNAGYYSRESCTRSQYESGAANTVKYLKYKRLYDYEAKKVRQLELILEKIGFPWRRAYK